MNERLVLRLWLPDKPGTLGAIATRLGEAHLSLIGIEIVEQGGGWAVDELVIEVQTNVAPERLEGHVVSALEPLQDVRIEAVTAVDEIIDPRVDALETAAELVAQSTREILAHTTVTRTHHDFSAQWTVLFDTDAHRIVASSGDAPADAWIRAFLAGSRSARRDLETFAGAQDVAHAEAGDVSLALVLGRSGRPFRGRERSQLVALMRIVGAVWLSREATS